MKTCSPHASTKPLSHSNSHTRPLQDTQRVYRDEINLIEVELLGREHFERVFQDRRRAEASGTAQLRRCQEQVMQTRVKFNKAKHQQYFPLLKGYK
jgi:hypothetical protein